MRDAAGHGELVEARVRVDAARREDRGGVRGRERLRRGHERRARGRPRRRERRHDEPAARRRRRRGAVRGGRVLLARVARREPPRRAREVVDGPRVRGLRVGHAEARLVGVERPAVGRALARRRRDGAGRLARGQSP